MNLTNPNNYEIWILLEGQSIRIVSISDTNIFKILVDTFRLLTKSIDRILFN